MQSSQKLPQHLQTTCRSRNMDYDYVISMSSVKWIRVSRQQCTYMITINGNLLRYQPESRITGPDTTEHIVHACCLLVHCNSYARVRQGFKRASARLGQSLRDLLVTVSNLQAVLEDLQTRFGALKTLLNRQG